MGWGSYLAFDLAILLAVISPGPAFFIAAQTGLGHGARAGWLVALGLAIGGCSWMLASILGVSLLFEIAPWSRMAIKLVGAAYLVYLAFGIWRGAGRVIGEVDAVKSRFLWRGFLTNAINPKAWLFTSAIAATIIPSSAPMTTKLGFIAHQFVIEAGWYTLVALVLSAPVMRAHYLRAKRGIDRVIAGMLGAIGVGFLWGDV